MRDSKQLLDDLNDKTAEEWNLSLAEEYGYEINEFIEDIRAKYTYIPISEDNITNKVSNVSSKTKEELISLVQNPLEKNEKIDVGAVVRDFNEISFDYGMVLSSHIFCGFNFIASDFSGVLFKEMLINNTLIIAGEFRGSKFVQATVIDCDLSSTKFVSSVHSKSYYYDCSFTNAIFTGSSFHDCVFYNCDFMNSDIDEAFFNSCLFHNCNFSNSSMKKVQFLSSNLSYCDFRNTNLRESECYDTDFTSIDFTSSNLDDVGLFDCMNHNVKIDTMYNHVFGLDEEFDNEDIIDFDNTEDEDEDGD